MFEIYSYICTQQTTTFIMKDIEIKTNNQVLKEILLLSDETLKDMVQEIEIRFNEDGKNIEFGRKFSEYDRVMTKFMLVCDFVKAIEKYTEITDELISFDLSGSIKGTLKIQAKIKRGDVTYPLITDVIYAGGHNVQRLHYRYLTKTSLPKTNNIDLVNELNNEKKRLTKIDKIQNEKISFETKIKETKDELEVVSKYTDDDILNLPRNKDLKYFIDKTWESTLADHKAFDPKRTDFAYEERRFSEMKTEMEAELKSKKPSMIRDCERRIKSYEDELKKLTKKIEALLK